MTIQMLRYLILAGDTGSLRSASEQAGVSQPTLSAQLAKLEATLGQTLLERNRQGVRPTPIGERVIQQARIVLREAQHIEKLCSPQVHPLAGKLRLGVIPTVSSYILPSLLPTLQRDYPHTDLHLYDAFTSELLSKLKESTIDAALLSLPIEDSTIAYESILEEPFYAVLPTGHELAEQETVSRDDLLRTDLLLLEEGHCLRAQTASFCQLPAHHRVIQATSVESLRLMVAAGLGCSVLPRMTVAGRYARHAGVTVRPFSKPTPSRSVILAWRHSYHEFGAMKKLAKTFRQVLMPSKSD